MSFFEWIHDLDPTINWDEYDSLAEIEQKLVETITKTGKMNLREVYIAFDCNSDTGLTLSGEL